MPLFRFAGTAYTAVYIWITTASHGFTSSNWTARPGDPRSFFLGLNVMLSALGGHGEQQCTQYLPATCSSTM